MSIKVQREQAILEIEKVVKSGEQALLEFRPDENPTWFRQSLSEALRKRGVPRTKTKLVDGTVYVIVSEPSYTEKLEKMLRKVMLRVDDEKLYDECLEVLDGAF